MEALLAAVSAIPWSGVSLGGIVTLAILSIFRGWLIPVSRHDREIQLLESRISDLLAERDTWREVAREAEKVTQQVRDQNRELLELSRTSAHALSQIAISAQGPKEGAERERV